MTRPSKVTVTEVGPRDGFQIEHDFIPTATKIALINQLIEAGVPRVEFSSFVSPRAVPQLADAADVLAGIDRSRGTELIALVPNAKGAARAVEAGADALCVFVSASETHNRKNVNRTVEESLAGFAEVMEIGTGPARRCTARSRPPSAARSRATCRQPRSAASPKNFASSAWSA